MKSSKDSQKTVRKPSHYAQNNGPNDFHSNPHRCPPHPFQLPKPQHQQMRHRNRPSPLRKTPQPHLRSPSRRNLLNSRPAPQNPRHSTIARQLDARRRRWRGRATRHENRRFHRSTQPLAVSAIPREPFRFRPGCLAAASYGSTALRSGRSGRDVAWPRC